MFNRSEGVGDIFTDAKALNCIGLVGDVGGNWRMANKMVSFVSSLGSCSRVVSPALNLPPIPCILSLWTQLRYYTKESLGVAPEHNTPFRRAEDLEEPVLFTSLWFIFLFPLGSY